MSRHTHIRAPAHTLLDVGPNPNVVRVFLLFYANSNSSGTLKIPAQHTGSTDESSMSLDFPSFNGGCVRRNRPYTPKQEDKESESCESIYHKQYEQVDELPQCGPEILFNISGMNSKALELLTLGIWLFFHTNEARCQRRVSR
jgi:hypothetical protein